MELIKYAVAHGLGFEIAGFIFALAGVILGLAFPVQHEDKALLGDGGIGAFVSSLRQYGFLRTMFTYMPLFIGAALFSCRCWVGFSPEQ